jgi:AraC family transcriptional regulator of adaptative response/methylated-DNA-[protein]-cysteine methyltransferase
MNSLTHVKAPNRHSLPRSEVMYAAVTARDASFDGIFFVGVRTTGIFCRPGCAARTPLRRNVTFFPSANEALGEGFRPCLRCRPLEPQGKAPAAIRRLIAEVAADPSVRVRDRDLRARGLDPATVRRWFQRHHGMTFQAYQRTARLARGLNGLARGEGITRAAFGSGYDSLSGFRDALRTLTGQSPSGSREMIVVHTTRVDSPLGPLLLGATDDALCLLEFANPARSEEQLGRLAKRLGCFFAPGTNGVTDRMAGELERYFARELKEFETPLLTPGTDFQRRVWAALREIPYGETRSYRDQAEAIGSPEAVRAVARANGANRIAIVIPCHRVIGADGSLTGYGGGLARKEFLLELERRAAS